MPKYRCTNCSYIHRSHLEMYSHIQFSMFTFIDRFYLLLCQFRTGHGLRANSSLSIGNTDDGYSFRGNPNDGVEQILSIKDDPPLIRTIWLHGIVNPHSRPTNLVINYLYLDCCIQHEQWCSMTVTGTLYMWKTQNIYLNYN